VESIAGRSVPIWCRHCQRTIHVPIAQLQQGSAKCPNCGRQIKPTPEFVAAIQVLK
jgi:uncharacterized paraquat-inducible protein A